MKRVVPFLLLVALTVACGSDGERGTTATSEPSPTTTTILPTTTAPARQMTVGGMGERAAVPDRAVLSLAVHCQRPSVEEATRSAGSSVTARLAALTGEGVAPSDVQSSDTSINPTYRYPQNDMPQIAGYEVYFGYRVTMADPTTVGTVLAKAVAAGGDDVRASSVWFHVDQTTVTDQAREVAWADARGRAEAIAALAGEPLGKVLDVHEKVLVTSPQGYMQGGEGDEGGFSVPMLAGVTGVTVLLTVTYAFGG